MQSSCRRTSGCASCAAMKRSDLEQILRASKHQQTGSTPRKRPRVCRRTIAVQDGATGPTAGTHAAGHTRNCINSSGNCSAPPWKKRQRLGCSNDCAGLPIRLWNSRGPPHIHFSSFRLCLTRWLQRFESGFNRSKLATPSPRLHLRTLISDLKAFIPLPVCLISFQPGEVSLAA